MLKFFLQNSLQIFENFILIWCNKKNNLKLDIDFLNNCKQVAVYPKLLIFKLPNVCNKGALSIRKRLLRSAIKKRNKELQDLSKELSLSKNFLSIIDFHILRKSITSYKKKLLQKLLYTPQKKVIFTDERLQLTIFTANKTITNLTQYELSQEEFDLLKTDL